MISVLMLIVLITFILWNAFRKPSNYPPGPWGIPVLGYIPLELSQLEAKLEELRKKHGNIFSWRIGSRFFVFLCEPKLIKEAFQSQAFIDRPDLLMLTLIEKEPKVGMVATNGLHWHNIRKFTLRHLRDLGMGKSKIVSAVQYEASELIKVMKKQVDISAPVPKAITPAVINILMKMVANKRYELDDKEVIGIDDAIHNVQESMGLLFIQDIFPWVKTILPESLYNLITKKYIYNDISQQLQSKFRNIINEHLKTLDENNSRDYIDDYLIEMKRKTYDPDSTMSIEDLVGCVVDLFGAGLETTTMTLYWTIFYLATFPKVQEKLHKEIDAVLPKGTLPFLDHKPRLPYTEAFLTEVLRFSSLASVGGFHSTSRDVDFAGYTIPKGSIVGSTLGLIHFDPKYFDHPNEFRPERFLNEEGKLASSKEGFLPFGTGKRQCLGESLARMELFIFTTMLLQEFRFSHPPNGAIDITPKDIPFFHQPRMDQDVFITVRN